MDDTVVERLVEHARAYIRYVGAMAEVGAAVDDLGRVLLVLRGRHAVVCADALVARYWEGEAVVEELPPVSALHSGAPERVVVRLERGYPRFGVEVAPGAGRDAELDPMLASLVDAFSTHPLF